MTPTHIDTPIRRKAVGNTPMNNQFSSPVFENDDEAERRASRARVSISNDSSIIQHKEGLDQCLKFFYDNKISKDNVWQMALIDHFRVLIDKHHKTLSSFRMVGSSLEASSKIYGIRVDSVHADVLRMSSGLIRQKIVEKDADDSVEPEVSQESDQPNPDEEQRPVRKKKRPNRIVSTVTKNKDSINAKLETTTETDAIFAKLNSTVENNNSAKKLLQYVLTSQSSELQLRMNYKLWKCSDAPVNDPNGTDVFDEPVVEMPDIDWNPKSTDVLRPQLAGYVISNTPAEDDGNEQPPDATIDKSIDHDLHFDIDGQVEPIQSDGGFMDLGDMDDDDFQSLTEADQHAIKACRGLRRATNIITDMTPDDASSNLEYSYRSLTEKFTRFWAGPSYWKFKVNRVDNAVRSTVTDKKKKTFKNKIEPIAFEDEANDSMFISIDGRPAAKLRKANIYNRWDARKTKLPRDFKLDRNRFLRYSLAPGLKFDIPTSSSPQTIESDMIDDNIHDIDSDNFGGMAHHHDDDDDDNMTNVVHNDRTNVTEIGAEFHGAPEQIESRDDGSMKFYLRGRPIVLHAPTDVRDTFEIAKVQPAPSKKLKLDWVYGYRGRDCRSNLYQLPTGEMAYFVAAVVVLYNVDEQSQRHYIGHTDDIKSLSVHPNKLLVATGQTAGRDASPHIRIWNSVSLATVSIIGNGDFTGPINSLSFSRADGGVLLAAIEDSPDKIISVWEVRGDRGQRITETRCSVDTIVCVEFHPLDRNQLVTAGKNHMVFWTLDQNGTLYKRMGVFEGREKPKYVTCISFTQNGDVISGDSNGNVIVWGRGTNIITRFFKKVHDGSIFSLCSLKDGRLASGGGKDGRIVLFDVDMNPTSVEMEVEPHFGAVRVIAEGKGSQFLVATTKNCILTGSFDLGLSPVIMGHTDEVWGLAVHPNLPQFVTGGRDRLLQLWDALSHSVVWSKDIGEQIQSCAFSTDGELIAVGTVLGKWMVFDTLTRELLAQYVDGQEPIQTIKFSPDGNLLAIGSRDNFIYIYQVGSKRLSKIGRCSGHSSFVSNLDWSEDSHQLRSNSGDYEVLYWNAELCRQTTSPSTLRDIKWATQTCTISFQTVGVWPENADGSDVNSVGRSLDGSLIVSGDDWGKVKLYSYPTSQPKSLAHTYGGHSSHVTAVEFMQDDARIISIGGNDTSVMQWTVS